MSTETIFTIAFGFSVVALIAMFCIARQKMRKCDEYRHAYEISKHSYIMLEDDMQDLRQRKDKQYEKFSAMRRHLRKLKALKKSTTPKLP